MTDILRQRVQALLSSDAATTLASIHRGIEKESLRITTQGTLARTPHPAALGSAQTHPYITTDYSESLLEFITPPSTCLHQPLEFLENLHRYTYRHIDEELLWVNSMPCMIHRDEDVPIAEYGSANVGRMKHIYRIGLGHRYGRKMQTIAGIHYNFSFPEAFWRINRELEAAQEDTAKPERESAHRESELQDYISRRYFDLTRNFQRYSWLLVYLFGASPALCASFLAGREHQLREGFGHSLYQPHATSLRMSDLGYQNNAQSSLAISYNSLDEYVRTLSHAIQTPDPTYQRLGLRNAQGEYQQLNTNILQIENEYYSSIRPKRTIHSGERPTLALQRRGVEYIEIRALDLNPFEPLGLNQEQIRFLDLFATWCLLYPSPPLDPCDLEASKANLREVVYAGRDTGITLNNGGTTTTLREWGQTLLEQMQPIAELFDRCYGEQEGQNGECDSYRCALQAQRDKLRYPETTPSGRILDHLERHGESFFRFAMDQSLAHRDHFLRQPPAPADEQHLAALARSSLAEQHADEARPQPAFEDYLAAYFQ